MTNPIRVWRVFAVTLLLTLLSAASVEAGPPGTWTRLETTEVRNIHEASLVRGSDGNLQVIFSQENATDPTDADLVVRRIAEGGVVGGDVLVTTAWSSMTVGPEITVDPDGTLRAWFHGIDTAAGTWMSVGDAVGANWSAPVKVTDLGGEVSVVRLADGTYFQAGSGEVHRGLDPLTPTIDYQEQFNGCCSYGSRLAFDEATSKLWHVWHSNASGADGIWAQEVDTTTGAPLGSPSAMPGLTDNFAGSDSFIGTARRLAVTAHPGGGVYVAHNGGYPDAHRVMVWRIGDASSTRVRESEAVEAPVGISADADGRLWVVWWEDPGEREEIFASVSNADATQWSPGFSAAQPPVNEPFAHYITVLAQTDRVDVVGNFQTRAGFPDANGGLFHTQLPVPPEWTNGDDTINGTPGPDFLFGGGGNDVLKGEGGRDDIFGGGGNDKLDGGRGKDLLNGGKGNDVCIKGKGDGDVARGCEKVVTRRHRFFAAAAI